MTFGNQAALMQTTPLRLCRQERDNDHTKRDRHHTRRDRDHTLGTDISVWARNLDGIPSVFDSLTVGQLESRTVPATHPRMRNQTVRLTNFPTV